MQCDLRKPSCSRCTRLGIRCIGSGEVRWRFIDESNDIHFDDVNPSSSQSSLDLASPVPGLFSTHVAIVQSSLASVLQEKDVRFSIMLWGDFLKDVPTRIETSPILQACSEALVHAFVSFRLRRGTLDAIQSYSTAITTLRCGLGDPEIATAMETICAVYLLIICQVRLCLDFVVIP